MITPPEQLLFLPGASGNTQFWCPVAELLSTTAQKKHVGWPGFGDTPSSPGVASMDDLVARVVADIDRPSALVAQFMGGIVAVRVALEHPGLITHLVLTVTSGGVDMSDLGFTHSPAVAGLIDQHLDCGFLSSRHGALP